MLSVNPVYKEENLISTMTSDFSFFANTRLSGIEKTILTNSSEKKDDFPGTRTTNSLPSYVDDDD